MQFVFMRAVDFFYCFLFFIFHMHLQWFFAISSLDAYMHYAIEKQLSKSNYSVPQKIKQLAYD